MAAKRTPSPAMQKMYEEKKQETIKKIRTVIRERRKNSLPVTRKNIIEEAGVSSGTLSKPYIIELLREEQVCQFAATQQVNTENGSYAAQELSRALKDIRLMKSKISSMEAQNNKLLKQKKELSEKNKELSDTNTLLRGQRQLLLERLDSAGISVGNIIIRG